MAPEVVNRKGHGTTADWWSFGVLMVSSRNSLAARTGVFIYPGILQLYDILKLDQSHDLHFCYVLRRQTVYVLPVTSATGFSHTTVNIVV